MNFLANAQNATCNTAIHRIFFTSLFRPLCASQRDPRLFCVSWSCDDDDNRVWSATGAITYLLASTSFYAPVPRFLCCSSSWLRIVNLDSIHCPWRVVMSCANALFSAFHISRPLQSRRVAFRLKRILYDRWNRSNQKEGDELEMNTILGEADANGNKTAGLSQRLVMLTRLLDADRRQLGLLLYCATLPAVLTSTCGEETGQRRRRHTCKSRRLWNGENSTYSALVIL